MPSTFTYRLARRTVLAGALTACVLSGCSITPPVVPAGTPAWTGRMGLQIHDASAAEQSFSAAFHLEGSAAQGRLDIYNPLGSQIARLHWQPGVAVLEQGDSRITSDALEDLLLRSLGSAIPVAAMFDWLQGVPSVSRGWQVDLSRHAQGRITAQRTQPTPEATLRIVLQQPSL